MNSHSAPPEKHIFYKTVEHHINNPLGLPTPIQPRTIVGQKRSIHRDNSLSLSHDRRAHAPVAAVFRVTSSGTFFRRRVFSARRGGALIGSARRARGGGTPACARLRPPNPGP